MSPKPRWLIDKEMHAERKTNDPDKCWDCVYLGRPHHWARHMGKEPTEAFECAIHQGCFNTKYSICCEDFAPK